MGLTQFTGVLLIWPVLHLMFHHLHLLSAFLLSAMFQSAVKVVHVNHKISIVATISDVERRQELFKSPKFIDQFVCYCLCRFRPKSFIVVSSFFHFRWKFLELLHLRGYCTSYQKLACVCVCVLYFKVINNFLKSKLCIS